MALRLQKPWLSRAEALRQARGQMGVYQLANEAGEVIFMSYAGSQDLGGLRGEISRSLTEQIEATQVRFEITTRLYEPLQRIAYVASSGPWQLTCA